MTEHADRWVDQAHENVEQWGAQPVPRLLLALQEELGEVTRAHLEAEHEGGDRERVQAELDDLAPLVFQLQWALDRRRK